MSTPPGLDNQDPALFGQTPWQTTGPFFHYALPWRGCADLVGESDIGARLDLFPADRYKMNAPRPKAGVVGSVIEIVGQIRDGAGQPVPDALVEIWQADGAGRYSAPDKHAINVSRFIGFGRSSTAEDGFYRFRTLRPGPVKDGGRVLAPHIAIGVQGRGLLKRLVTRLYFAEAPENANDPILAMVPPNRQNTLIATINENVWLFDIVLQGEGETVFFEF